MKVRAIHLVMGLMMSFQLYAIGLGEIRVYSHLNEPFRAEIPLIDAGRVDPNNIKADIGDDEEFARVGLTRNEVLSFIHLKIKRNQEGKWVVALSSIERIQTPYLEMLVDLAWPDGELYRAYTVLLDPPHYALPEETGTLAQAIPLGELKKSGNKTWFSSATSTSNERETAPKVGATYGPTLVDENIWQIAKRYQLDKLTLPQVVLAIVGQNPDAFKEGNLNGLKAASHLIIPSMDEMSKVPVNLGAQEVEVHDIAWRTQTQIHHVLAPPYIQGLQELTSLIPSSPFPLQPLPAPELNIKNASKTNEGTMTDATHILAARLKVFEMNNIKLAENVTLKEKENQRLRATIEMLRKQVAELQLRLNNQAHGAPSLLWLFPFVVLIFLGGYFAWKRYRGQPQINPPYDEPTLPEEKETQEPSLVEVTAPSSLSTQQDVQAIKEDEPLEVTPWTEAEPEKEEEQVIPSEPILERSEEAPSLHIKEAPPIVPQPPIEDNKPLNTFEFQEDLAEAQDIQPEEPVVKSPQALETLLELSKTYISRGDLQAARQALQEILTFGSQKQMEEAELLLEQIKDQK